jgi:hypothetical protein
MLSRFITKGTISAVLSVITLILGSTGHGALATILTDPNTIQNILIMISAGSALYAGAAQGVPPKPAALPTAPATVEDPYPGYDWDPVNGWVKIDG